MTLMTSLSNAVGEHTVPSSTWHMTLGAQVESEGVRFRVWAPKRARVDVVLANCIAFGSKNSALVIRRF